MQFGHIFRKHRRLLDLTQLDVAAELGINSASVSSVECGRKRPIASLARYALERFDLSEAERAEVSKHLDKGRFSRIKEVRAFVLSDANATKYPLLSDYRAALLKVLDM